MPVISGGGGGAAFNGGTITGQTVFSEANKDTTPLQIKPVTGATTDATNQLEWYDDAGNLLGFVDAAGNVSASGASGQGTFIGLGDDTGAQLLVNGGNVHALIPAGKSFWVQTGSTVVFEAFASGGILTAPPAPAQKSLSSGVGAQIVVTRDANTYTPVTFNPTAGAAATCAVEISPDSVTYTTLWIETEPAGVALDGTVHGLRVYVPAAWYLRLTTTNATTGTTTYY